MVKIGPVAAGREETGVFTQGFLLAIAGDRGKGAVHVINVALGVGYDDAFHSAVKNLAGQLKLILSLLALGDILHRAQHAQGLSLLVISHIAQHVHHALTAVRADDAVLNIQGRLVVGGLVQRLLHQMPIIRMHQFQKGLPSIHRLLRRSSEDAIVLRRPSDLSTGKNHIPITHVDERLGFVQDGLALAELFNSKGFHW